MCCICVCVSNYFMGINNKFTCYVYSFPMLLVFLVFLLFCGYNLDIREEAFKKWEGYSKFKLTSYVRISHMWIIIGAFLVFLLVSMFSRRFHCSSHMQMISYSFFRKRKKIPFSLLTLSLEVISWLAYFLFWFISSYFI